MKEHLLKNWWHVVPEKKWGILILLAGLSLGITAQTTRTISGSIKDTNGEGLPGATVQEKGTSNGSITDIDGNFSLQVQEESTLVISYIGFLTQEIPVGSQSVFDIALVPDLGALEEVVVIGYGTTTRKDLTGSVASLTSKDFGDGLPLAPEQLLQGRVTGVNIIQNSGTPGSGSTVRIRGASSITAGNDPLYVIDGVPFQFGEADNASRGSTALPTQSINPLNIINPSDIESIDILKDASAAAIYGSRGANGVIIITTKNKKGNENVTYDGYVGVSEIRRKLPILTASQFRSFGDQQEVAYQDGGENTDWQDEIFQAGVMQSHSLSFSGGSDNSSFRASIGYTSQEGIIISSKLDKYVVRLNGKKSSLNNKLNFDYNLTYSVIEEDKAAVSNVGGESGNVLIDALRWNPTLPVYNDDGTLFNIGDTRINPNEWSDVRDDLKTNLFLGNILTSYEIIDGLTANINIGHNNEFTNRYTSIPSTHPVGESSGGIASISKFQNQTFLTETDFRYSKSFGGIHELTAVLGYSFQRFESEELFAFASGFVSSSIQEDLIQTGDGENVTTSFRESNRLASYYGRINYKLKDNYLFTFTLRRDGSSRFGENNRWGLFPSGAFAWNISDEAFLAGNDLINNLKLRTGYGVIGNQEIGNNLYEALLTVSGASSYIINGESVSAVAPVTTPNPDLKWEETAQANIGIDFGVLNNRITGTLDFYQKKTKDLLLRINPPEPALGTQVVNVGEVENRGVEINLNGDIIRKSNFTWTANINWSRNINEVISLGFTEEIRRINATGVIGERVGITIVKPGLPLGTFYGRVFTGLDEDGIETYLDVDGEEGADLTDIGNPNPDFIFGINQNITYKGFDLAINLRGVYGNDVYNNTANEFSYPNIFPGSNVLEAATTQNTSLAQRAEYSSRWIEDGSYMRLDNLSIGYSFNVSQSIINNLRIYATGKNLFVITGYNGYDPEFQSTIGDGIDYSVYPRPRIYMLGASISF